MKREGGFTTVELVIAVGVLAIVLTVSVLFVRSARADMRDAIRLSDIKQIQAGMELYFAEQYSYPVVDTAIALGAAQSICLGKEGFASSCPMDRPYMPIVPGSIDGNPYLYVSRDNQNASCKSSPCVKYAMQFTLEKARGTLAAGPNCARPEGIKPGACQ
jgi:type II secretory pathway pseudopilin PulG